MKEENIILDPGIGFGKTGEQNMEVLARLDELTQAYPYPWLLGVSRKRFIGTILDLPAEERDEGTAAVNLWGIEKGCTLFRVHDVKTTARSEDVGCAQKTGTPAAWEKVTVVRRDRCEHPSIEKRALWRSFLIENDNTA